MALARFSTYSLSEHFFARILRKGGASAKEAAQITATPLKVESLMRMQGSKDGSPEVQCLIHECQWKDQGKHAIFINDIKTLQAIESIKIDNFDPETLPEGSWMIVVPKAAWFPSFLWTINLHGTWEKTVRKHFPTHDIRRAQKKLAFGFEKKCFSVNFRKGMFTFNRNAGAENIINEIDPLPAEGWGDFDNTISDEEESMMLRMTMLGVRTLVYRMIYPDRFTDAAPSFQSCTKPMGGNKKMIGGIGGAASITAVGEHFRQLRADRYYKGDWAEKPRGTRFVKVEPYVRGAKKITTVENEQ